MEFQKTKTKKREREHKFGLGGGREYGKRENMIKTYYLKKLIKFPCREKYNSNRTTHLIIIGVSSNFWWLLKSARRDIFRGRGIVN